ncbi:50S ribosomal protein L23 [Candidatus Falkowbacteria bacterium CG10_big_fil_rev_8_21_14_0_10_43_10]|uniref:Large ribosomal subunit protein uL23 n=1 Tax=Candidatus Falkowbacteria bacterium CG10_big_fil_rev_8_21_14_0_10_43_10 TaxID=1974567 RepID=A0A2H0V2R1_9BACT|nr:MAG: 50S ribosomal protein L23 [Candidatus Falkowbacteria bacterium CG10_big_fil_rev_8_21_14_0_10_43_10]
MKDLYGGESGNKKSKTEKGELKKKGKFSEAYRILVKPLVTEKASGLGVLNKYAFVISDQANKILISRAVEQVYGVKPEKVNIISMKGKQVRSRRVTGRRKNWKKAIVTLPEGKSINIYEGV